MGGLDGSGGAGRLRPGGSNSGVDGPLRGAVCRQQHITSGDAKASLGVNKALKGSLHGGVCRQQHITSGHAKAWRRADCMLPGVHKAAERSLCGAVCRNPTFTLFS